MFPYTVVCLYCLLYYIILSCNISLNVFCVTVPVVLVISRDTALGVPGDTPGDTLGDTLGDTPGRTSLDLPVALSMYTLGDIP